MTKAAVITTDKVVTFTDVETLADYQRLVGGFIEAVSLSDGSTMYIHEEGIRYQREFNPMATDVCGLGGRPDLEHQGILGDVVVVGPPDDEGSDTDLTGTARDWVTRIAEEDTP